MLRPTILVFFLLFLFLNESKAQEIFQRLYKLSGNSSSNSIYQTSDNGFIIGASAGNISGFNYDSDFLILKTDSVGNEQWNKTYGGIYPDFSNKMIITSDSNYIIVGGTNSFGPIGLGFNQDTIRENVYIIKVDTLGNIKWKYSYGDTLINYAYDVLELFNGDLIIVGVTNMYNSIVNNSGDILLLCLSKDGTLKWSKIIYSLDAWTDLGQNITLAPDNGFYIAGVVIDYINSANDGFLLKTDSLGNIVWSKRMGDNESGIPNKMVADNNGGVIYGFTTAGFGVPNYTDMILVNFDSTGSIVWSNKYGSAANSSDNINSLIKLKDNAGYMFETVCVVKTDIDGNIEWSHVSSGEFSNSVCAIAEKSNRAYALVGNGSYSALSQISLVQLDSTGNNCENTFFNYPYQQIMLQPQPFMFSDSLITLSTDSFCNNLTTQIVDSVFCFTATSLPELSQANGMIQIFPNPFSNTINITSTSTEDKLDLRILDLSGKVILKQNNFSGPLVLKYLRNGIYIIKLTSNNSEKNYKIVKID